MSSAVGRVGITPGRVADPEADRAAREHGDEQRQYRGGGGGQVRQRVDADEHPHRGPPAGLPPAQAEHGGVGDEGGQVPVERRRMADVGLGHGDRVVQPPRDPVPQQVVGGGHRRAGQHAGRHRLGQRARLAADELADGQRERQRQQREERNRPHRFEHGVRHRLAHLDDVGFHAVGGRARHDAEAGQHDHADDAGEAAQQIGGSADPVLAVVLDQDRRRPDADVCTGPAAVRRRARPR